MFAFELASKLLTHIVLDFPVVPFYPFLGRVPLLKQTAEKSWYPYSNLSTGGPGVYT